MPDASVADLPMQDRAAPLVPGTLDAEARTIELVWSTGARVRRYDWMRDRWFDEELSLDPAHVDLGRLQAGANLLECHGRWSLDSVLGVVERAWLAAGEGGQPEGRAIVRFSARDSVQPVWDDVRAGIIRNVSVGYLVRRFEMIERQGEVPIYRAIDWEPGEISLVPVGADPGSGTRSSESGEAPEPGVRRHPCSFVRNEETDMTKPTPAGDPAGTERGATAPTPPATPAAAAPAAARDQPTTGTVVDLDQARAAGRADALAYVAEVTELCTLSGLAERASEFIAAGTPTAAVRKALLEARAADSAARGIVGSHAPAAGGTTARNWDQALTRAGVKRKEA